MRIGKALRSLSDLESQEVRGGMFAATMGSGRPLISPARPSSFSGRDLENRMIGGALGGGLRGYQLGGPQGARPGALGGALAGGMGYCLTHASGGGPTYSSNLASSLASPIHRAPNVM